jgi:hypothetical protein
MNTIDAEAAKLAGLQIDLLQKMRSGHVTLGHLKWFLGLNVSERDGLVRNGIHIPRPQDPVASGESKFALLVDLGILTVPEDYDHATRLTTFSKLNRKNFYYYNDEITDRNFPNPTRVLSPGDELRVRAFKQVVGGKTTSEERLAFLATQKAIHTGAQGASLVFEKMRYQLPKGKWYASFDDKDRLWADNVGYHRVPYVRCHSGGVFEFILCRFDIVWGDDNAFLCFTEAE